jgi:hypothetical protein
LPESPSPPNLILCNPIYIKYVSNKPFEENLWDFIFDQVKRKSDPAEDGAGKGGYAGVADMGVSEVEVLVDDEDERRDGKGGKEA